MSDSPTPQSDQRRPRRDRALLPILLISAGVLLLLERVGLFDWSLAFGVLQLWPLLLIAVGVDILTHGRYRAAVVIATVVIGALLWRVPGWGPGTGAPAETREIAYALAGARRAEIQLEHGVGRLSVRAADAAFASTADGPGLLRGTIATGPGERLEEDYRVDGEVAELELRSKQRGTRFSFETRDRRFWDLQLARGVPVSLDVDAGVGASDLALRGLTLAGLDVDAGVGEVLVTLPETGGYEATIDAGVGEVSVRIPRSVEVRLDASAGLGGVDVRGSWVGSGDRYETEGWAGVDAAERISLRVNGGVGKITVERID